METIIRRASIADKDAIWNFIKAAYGDFSKHIIPKRWTWQYRENPCIDEGENYLPIILAIKGDQIVGQACVTPVELKVGDDIYHATWGTDFIVLPVCRGEGVGTKLMEIENEHFKFMIGLWMPFVTRRIADNLGYKMLDPVYVYWRPVRLHGFFINHHLMKKTQGKAFSQRLVKISCRLLFLDRLTAGILNLLWRLRDFFERFKKNNRLYNIQEVEYFDEGIDKLWHSTHRQYEIIVKRDKEFLNWRYSPNHQLTYRKFIATKDGETKGYFVLRQSEPEELNIGKIVDLYASRNDQQVIEEMIRYAIQFLGNDVDVIECVSSVQEYQQILSKCGFFKIETAVPMYRCEDTALVDKIEAWRNKCFFTKGDHDWDQYAPVRKA